MVLRCMQNSGHGGPHTTRVMTIFVFYVNPEAPDIENFDVYGGLQYPARYLIFFLVKVPFECRRNHVWGLIFNPSYDHFYKCDNFGNEGVHIYEGREKGKGKREGLSIAWWK